MDEKNQQPYMYVRNAELLYNSKGKEAKARKEADDIVKIIKPDIKDDENEHIFNGEGEEDVTKELKDWKETVFQAFKNGPLKWKPVFDIDHKSSCDKLKAEPTFTRKASEVGDDFVKESRMCGSIDAATDAKSEGHAPFAFGETQVAAAEYSANVKGEFKASCQGKIDECSTKNGYERHVTIANCKAEGKINGDVRGSAELNVLNSKRKMEVDAKTEASGKASFLAGHAYINKGSKGVQAGAKALHVKAEGKGELEAGLSVGKHRAKLKTKAEGRVKFKAFDGQFELAAKKRKDGGIYIPGIEGTVGQAEAEGEVEFNVETGINGKKRNQKTSGKASFNVVKFRALSVDVRPKNDCGKVKETSGFHGHNVNVCNVEAIGKKKGSRTARSVESGSRVNIGNVSATGIDNRNIISTKASSGLSVDMGNITATGLGHKGVKAEVNRRDGVKMFNLSVGIARDTGASVSTEDSRFNINLTIGPPSFNQGVGDYNIGIPFLSGSGNSGGGSGGDTKGNDGDPGDADSGIGLGGHATHGTRGENGGHFNGDGGTGGSKWENDSNFNGYGDTGSVGILEGNGSDDGVSVGGGDISIFDSGACGDTRVGYNLDDFNIDESDNEETKARVRDSLSLQRQGGVATTSDIKEKNLKGHIFENSAFDQYGNVIRSGDDECLIVVDQTEEDDVHSIVEALHAEEVDPSQPFTERMSGYGFHGANRVTSGLSEIETLQCGINARTGSSNDNGFESINTKEDSSKESEEVKSSQGGTFITKMESRTTSNGKQNAKTELKLEDEVDYNKYLAGLVGKRLGNSKPKKSTKLLNSTKKELMQSIWHDKERLKRALVEEYTDNPESGYQVSGEESKRKTNAHSHKDVKEDEYKPINPPKTEEPKKPFGANKNIHTIFTIQGATAKPVKYIKDNVACFADK